MRVTAVALLVVTATMGLVMAATLEAAAPVAASASLVAAARQGDSAGALALLAQQADVNAAEGDGTTALHWAVHNNDKVLVERLLKAGARVNARNDYGATPLAEAAILADVALLERLLKAGADVESANDDGQTALMLVARNGNVEAAKLLLRHHANINAREKWRQQTALMWAAAQAQPAMVRLLVAKGAEVNARSLVNDWERQVTAEPRSQARPAGGFTPLLYAARRGCAECARALVEGGADVNLADPFGVTPLLMATQNFSFDTAAYLLSKGANPNRWDAAGRSPLYAAVDLNTIPFGGRADRPSLDDTAPLELIRRLIAAGANPNLQLKLMPPYRSLRDDRGADGLLAIGATPLLRAAKAGDIPAIKLLLAAGAKVDLPNVNGITPLMAAAGSGSSKIDTRGRYKTPEQAIESIDLLLAAGADVNSRDAQGQTALFGAAMFGWNDVIRMLVAHGAKVDALDARGKFAVDAAMGAGGGGRAGSDPQPETAALLRSLMAQSGAAPAR
jgi:ankyrin repeat protein